MIGRREEQYQLERIYNSNKAELLAIYGRRRVGKTFLVDETFGSRITFRHAGLSPETDDGQGGLQKQLNHFYRSLILHGMKECREPDSWMEAFFLLEKYLQEIENGNRQLVFLDELPWLDTPRSGFVQAFEGFWNNWGCHRKNLKVVVCGSAVSWMQDKLINDHGGLYNRVTYEIKLLPFTLSECEEFYKENNVRFSRYDIIQSYMIFGGIPYYLGYMDSRFSLAQNVDRLFFAKNAVFKNEYARLFDSIFVNPEVNKSIVRLLHTRNSGYTRKEIIEKLHISNGGRLSAHLNALIACDLVMKYVPFGYGKRDECYKLIDPFCLFYLHFADGQKEVSENYWQQNVTSQPIAVWRGFAFENVCFNHIEQIKKSLGISGVITTSQPWSKRADDETGMQIDLLINRKDNVMNMCEMKFYGDEFAVDKDYYRKLLKRQQILLGMVSPRISIHSTLVTTYGLVHNEYSGAFTNTVTMDDLFE